MPEVQCIALSNIDEALNCQEQDNMGGIVPKLIFGFWDDVDVWPAWPVPTASGQNEVATPLSLAAAGVITGDVTMKTGTCAYMIEFSADTGSFSIAPQGEQGAISFLYTLTFINKRIRKLILGFLNAAKNRKMFFIVQDNNGVWYLMGDKRRAALLQPSDGAVTGTTPTDINQVTTIFHYVAPRALCYEGDTEDLLTVAVSNSSQGGVSG